MESSLFNRLQATVLAVITVGLVVLAVLNYRQETQFQQPDDGVWWREVQGGLEAVKVLPNGPGQRAGIRESDLLTGAEVLPDTPGQRPEMQTQDLLTNEKPLPESATPSATPSTPKRNVRPKEQHLTPITIVRLADLSHVLYRTEVYGK